MGDSRLNSLQKESQVILASDAHIWTEESHLELPP